jgi:hypothetical protein
MICQLQMHTLNMLCKEVFPIESMVGEGFIRVEMAPALCSGVFATRSIACDVSCGADVNIMHGQVANVANDLGAEQARRID